MTHSPLSRRSYLKAVLAGAAAVSVAALQRVFAYGKPSSQVLEADPTPIPKPTIDPALANLPSLTLSAPKGGSTFKASGRVTFSWNAFPGAASYLLVFISPTGKKITFTTTNTSHDRYMESMYWGGTFTWYVAVLDAKGKPVGFSGFATFDKPELPSFKEGIGGGRGGSDGGGSIRRDSGGGGSGSSQTSQSISSGVQQ